MSKKSVELTFTGAAIVRSYSIPRYRRFHPTREGAVTEAARVHAVMRAKGLPVAAHAPVFYT